MSEMMLMIDGLEEFWTPVSECLPEPGDDVIVTARLKSGQDVVRMAKYTKYGFSGNGNMSDVKAWMYAPNAYKEDEVR